MVRSVLNLSDMEVLEQHAALRSGTDARMVLDHSLAPDQFVLDDNTIRVSPLLMASFVSRRRPDVSAVPSPSRN